jgi:hypothetical protein
LLDLGFGENIGELVMCAYMDQSYLPFLYVVSQKMIHHFYVLGFGMEHWVLATLMALVLSH